jgi:dsDNA-binding SOS-regulon protein
MLTFRDDYDKMLAGANTAHVLLDYLDQGLCQTNANQVEIVISGCS